MGNGVALRPWNERVQSIFSSGEVSNSRGLSLSPVFEILDVVGWLGVGETMREARSAGVDAEDAGGAEFAGPAADDCDAGVDDVDEADGGLGEDGCCLKGVVVVIVRTAENLWALSPRAGTVVELSNPTAPAARNERAICDTGMVWTGVVVVVVVDAGETPEVEVIVT